MEWITKKYAKVTSGGSDVTISICKQDIGQSRVSVTFRNNVYAKITKNEYVAIAVSGARLYFREYSPAEGFKLTSYNKARTSCVFRIPESALDLSKTRISTGDYRLQYDPSMKMYYIDGNNRIKYE